MDGKTIAQIAEEIGVTKQAIQKKIKKEPLQTVLALCITKKGTTIYINAEGEKLIKSEYDFKGSTSTKKKMVADNSKSIVKENVKIPVKSATTRAAVDSNQSTEAKEKLPTTQMQTATMQDKQIKDTMPTDKPVTQDNRQAKNANKEQLPTTKEETTTKNANRNYYEILGVPTTATNRELNIAFFNSNKTKAEKEYLYEIMKVLCKSETRLEYDKKIGLTDISAQQEKKADKTIPVEKNGNNATNELLTMLNDILMILGDSDRIIRLNTYESKIWEEMNDYFLKLYNKTK